MNQENRNETEKNYERINKDTHKCSKELEKKDKMIWTSMWLIMAVSVIAMILGLFLCINLIPEGIWQVIAILGICILFLLPCFYALKLEISVGSYRCKECGCKIIPTYMQALNAMHLGTTRYLKCPDCGKRTWCKKDFKKIKR